MSWLLLIITVFTLALQNVFTKQYNSKQIGGQITYLAFSTFFAIAVFFVASGFKFSYESGIFIYSLVFSVCYSAALLGLTTALACGLLSVTSLIMSYSLIIPTAYGILFLNEPVKNTMCVGFVLLVISLVLVNYKKGTDKFSGINSKWLFAIIIAFIGNGGCSVVQRQQQIAFDGKYKSEFMMISLIISAVVLICAALLLERKYIVRAAKQGWYLSGLYGSFNGLTNLFAMYLGNMLPVSLVFPVLSGGSIIVTAAISVLAYKEKLSKVQLAGVLTGTASIVFLNL